MKPYLMTAVLALTAAPLASADVGVSLSIGEPGFYGHIDIGDYPRPRLIYREPVIIHRVDAPPPPVYLHVPPGHARHWADHCHKYHACNQRVYFVENDWYEQIYVPEYRKKHAHKHKGKGKHKKHKD